MQSALRTAVTGPGAVVEPGTVVLGTVPTPLGAFGAVITPLGLARLTFPEETASRCEEWARRRVPGARVVASPGALTELSEQLTAYLEGVLRSFSIPLDLRGTAFQLDVWDAMLEVGYGDVRTYSEIAARIGRPGAVRAVGMASGSNPVPIIVPCHRIVGSNRSLTGYGGGLDLKERLLRLEGVTGVAYPAGQAALL